MDQSSPPDEAEHSQPVDPPNPFKRDKLQRSFDSATYKKLLRNNSTNSCSKRNVNDLKKLFEKGASDEKPHTKKTHNVNAKSPLTRSANHLVDRTQSYEEDRKVRSLDRKTARSVETVHSIIESEAATQNNSEEEVEVLQNNTLQNLQKNSSKHEEVTACKATNTLEITEAVHYNTVEHLYLKSQVEAVDNNRIPDIKSNTLHATISEAITKNSVPLKQSNDSVPTQNKLPTPTSDKTNEADQECQLRVKPLIEVKPLKNEDIAQRVSNIEKLQSSLRKSVFEDTPILSRKILTDQPKDSPSPQRRSIDRGSTSKQTSKDRNIELVSSDPKSFDEVDKSVICSISKESVSNEILISRELKEKTADIFENKLPIEKSDANSSAENPTVLPDKQSAEDNQNQQSEGVKQESDKQSFETEIESNPKIKETKSSEENQASDRNTKEEVLPACKSLEEDKPTKEPKAQKPQLARRNSKARRFSTERRVSFSPDIEHFPIPAPRKSLPAKSVQVVTVEVKTVQVDSVTPVVLTEEKDVNSNYKSSEYENLAVDEVEENAHVLKDSCEAEPLIESENVLRKTPGRRRDSNKKEEDCENSTRKLERANSAPVQQNSPESEEVADNKSKETTKTYPAGILRKPSIRSVDDSWRKAAEEVLNASKNRLSLAETTNGSLTNSPSVKRSDSKTIFNILSGDNFDKSPSPNENKPNPFHPKTKSSWRNSLISKPKTKPKPKLKEVKAKVEPEAESEIEIRYILPRQASEDSIYKIKSALDLFVMDDKKEKKRTNSFKKIFRSFGKKDKDKDKKKPKKIENEIVGDNAQNESVNRNSKEVHVVNKNLPEIPNEEAEKRYAQMHINRYNQVRANFEQSEDYVCMDNGAKYTYINTSEVNKYIDTSSSSNTLNSESLAFRDSDNSSGLEKFLETPPRAFDTYQNVQLVKPKANIPINSERPLPLPYQDGDLNDGVYGTVYDRKRSSETSDRSLSSRSPSLEGSKLKLPANREKVELQPRIKSPIPPNEVSTDKIIATELLKGKKKEDRLSSPSHQRLEIDIDYPGELKGKPPVSPQNKMLQNLEAGEWHKKQREMHLSPSLEAMELQMRQMGRISPGVEDWQKLKQMRDLDDWKKHSKASPNVEDSPKSPSEGRQRNSLDDRQNKQRNLDEWQHKQRNSFEEHMERVEDWQKKHIASEENRMSPAVEQQIKQRGSFSPSVDEWQKKQSMSPSENKVDENQKHRYVPMSAIQLSPIPKEKPLKSLSPSLGDNQFRQQNINKIKPDYIETDGVSSDKQLNISELTTKHSASPESERQQKNFAINSKTDDNVRMKQNATMEAENTERSRKISSQQEEFQRKFGRTANALPMRHNSDVSASQYQRSGEGFPIRQGSEYQSSAEPKRKISENCDVPAMNQYAKSESQGVDYQRRGEVESRKGAQRTRNRNDSANYQNDYEIYGQRNQDVVDYQNKLRQQQMNQSRLMEHQKQMNQNRTLDPVEYQKQMNQNRTLDPVEYQKQMHQHNFLEWQRLHSKPPIERRPTTGDQRRLQSPPVEQQRRLQQNEYSTNPQVDQDRRTLSGVSNEALYGSNQQRLGAEAIYGQREVYQQRLIQASDAVFRSNQQKLNAQSEGMYGTKVAPAEARNPPAEAIYGGKVPAQEAIYGSKVLAQEAIYGSKVPAQEALYGSKAVPSEGIYGSKTSSLEGTYGGKHVSQEVLYGGNQQVRTPSSDGIYGSKSESLYGSGQNSVYGNGQMTTNVMVHVDSHSPQNRSTTPVSRSTTPVNLRSPSHLSLLQRTPPKHEIRQSVEAFCWKELKKMKEQEDIQMQIQLSNYGYLEDPVISHRSRSMTSDRARNTRRSTSLPREVQRQRRMEDAGMGQKVREPIYGQRVAQNPNPNPNPTFVRNSPQRSTIGTTGVGNGQRPIFNRGSLTQSFNKDPQGLYYKRVGFHSPQNPDNPQAWPTKNGYTQSPPQRRIEVKTEASLEDEVFLPEKMKDLKGNELTREEIFMMNQQRQRQMREMKEPIYAFRPLPNEAYRQNGQREPIYGSRPPNRNEIYGTRAMPNIREEGVYTQKPNLQRNNSFTQQRYDLPPTSEPIYGRNPNEIYGRLGHKVPNPTVSNKVCDMYGKIHDTPVQQSGVLYGQLQRNSNAPPVQYQSYNHIQPQNQNFVRGTRLTASVNDMNRYYQQPPDRPLPPIPNDKKSRRSNEQQPDSSFQKTRIAGK